MEIWERDPKLGWGVLGGTGRAALAAVAVAVVFVGLHGVVLGGFSSCRWGRLHQKNLDVCISKMMLRGNFRCFL